MKFQTKALRAVSCSLFSVLCSPISSRNVFECRGHGCHLPSFEYPTRRYPDSLPLPLPITTTAIAWSVVRSAHNPPLLFVSMMPHFVEHLRHFFTVLQIRGHGGNLYFENTVVTSWDTPNREPQEKYEGGRSFLNCLSEKQIGTTCAKNEMGECRMVGRVSSVRKIPRSGRGQVSRMV